jgi:signal transduction histidine kinase
VASSTHIAPEEPLAGVAESATIPDAARTQPGSGQLERHGVREAAHRGNFLRDAHRSWARRLVGRGWLVVLAAGVVAIILYYVLLKSGVADAVFVMFTISIGVAGSAIWAALRARGASRVIWFAVGSGMTLSTLAIVPNYTYTLVTGLPIPFPSPTDAAWLMAYPCYAVALARLARQQRGADNRGQILDTAILALGGGTLIWVFVLEPVVHSAGMPPFAHLVSVLYTVMDLVVFALLVRLAVNFQGSGPISLLLASFVFLLVSDCLYAIELSNGTYQTGGPNDAMWLLANVLIGAAAWHPGARAFPQISASQVHQVTLGRLSFLSGVLLIGPLLLLTRPVDVTFLACSSAASFVLVMARMTWLNRGLRDAQTRLVDSARQAGMAEIATNVLHNVGNVLNSVNVSANLVNQKVRGSKSGGLVRAVALMREHADDLGEFITTDPRGRQLPDYLDTLSATLATERESIVGDLLRLTSGVAHIKEIVGAQQSLSGVSGVTESVRVSDLVEDALRMSGLLGDNEVAIIRDFPEDLLLSLDRHRALLILLNLMSNAGHAMKDNDGRPRRLTVRSEVVGGPSVRITVSDSGVGIPPENMTRIFVHGFTTHKDGHGFGLHSSALAATEMGGSLTVHDTPDGIGAAFALEMPLGRQAVTA